MICAAWNGHDSKSVAALFAEDGAREEFSSHEVAQGREAVAAWVEMYLDAVPDAVLDFRNTFSDGAGVTTVGSTFGIPGLAGQAER